jgi:cation transport regulator ChaC
VAEPIWVFGYGSLVAPSSMASTIGRPVDPRDGWSVARLDGYGRRWNYGSMHQRGDWHGPYGYVEAGVVICLGVERADGEECNGVVVRVTEHELAALDWRERDYERTDVTDHVRITHGRVLGRVVTYVPRASAVDRYILARDERRAAVLRPYVELVEEGFAALGREHLEEFSRTPEPDVPVVDPLRRTPVR